MDDNSLLDQWVRQKIVEHTEWLHKLGESYYYLDHDVTRVQSTSFCMQRLHLPQQVVYESNDNPRQLINCMIEYESAYAFALSEIVRSTLQKNQFYSMSLKSCIKSTWLMICRGLFPVTGKNNIPSMSQEAGMMAVGLFTERDIDKNGKRHMEFPFMLRFPSYSVLFDKLVELATSCYSEENKCFICRKITEVEVLSLIAGNDGGPSDGQPFKELGCDIDGNDLDQNVTAPRQSLDRENAVQQCLQSSFKEHFSSESFTYERRLSPMDALRRLVPNTFVDSEGELRFPDWDENNRFLNSPQVVMSVLKYLHCKFFPDGPSGEAIPLDVMAGVTPKECGGLSYGPLDIKAYLQLHPEDSRRLVVILVFENYLSDHFVEKVNEDTDKAPFMMRSNGSYLRVANNSNRSVELDPIIMKFGALGGEAVEATSGTMEFEVSLLDMTTVIYSLMDKGLKDVMSKFAQYLSGNYAETQSVNDIKLTAFNFPVGEKVPLDKPDTLACHAQQNKPYGPHSDTTHARKDNHDNNVISSHERAMRIFTHCFTNARSHKELILRMRHGLPHVGGGNNANYCTVIGRYSTRELSYRNGSNGYDQGAPLYGSVHGHIQLWGSQGSLYHYLHRVATRSGLCRKAFTSRCLAPQQDTPEKTSKLRTNNRGEPIIVRTVEEVYTHIQVMKTLMGKNRLGARAICPSKRSSETAANQLKNVKSPRGQKLNNFETTKHKNGVLLEVERITRPKIVGLPTSMAIRTIATGVVVGKALYDKGCSMQFLDEEGKTIVVGPHTDEAGRYLLKPGTELNCQELDSSALISHSTRQKEVVNVEHRDVLNIRRFWKNDVSVARELYSILTEESRHVMGDIVVRGRGGGAMVADQYGMDSADPNFSKCSPTHIVSTNQRLDTKQAKAWFQQVHDDQVVSIFVNGVYLGVYYAKSVNYSRSTKEEFEREKVEMNKYLGLMHKMDPRLYPQASLDEQTEMEMSGMQSKCYSITYSPIDPELMKHWEGLGVNDNVEWRVVEVSHNEVKRPIMFHSVQEIQDKFSPTSINQVYCNANALLSESLKENPLSMFTEDAACRILGRDVSDVIEDNDHIEECKSGMEDSDVVAEEYSSKCCFDVELHLFNSALHASAVAMVKGTFPECVGDDDRSQIVPPRSFFKLLTSSTELDIWYSNAVRESGLGSLIARPVHPSSTTLEPPFGLADESTNTTRGLKRKPELQRHRCGSEFITGLTTQDEAWNLIYKTVMCTIMSSTSLLQLTSGTMNLDSFESFIAEVKKYSWNRRCVHRTFRDSLGSSSEVFIGFLESFRLNGKQMFIDAVGDAGSNSRHDILIKLNNQFSERCGVIVTTFEMQVIMRTIENIIYKPFGDVESVPPGYGGRHGAICFYKQYKCETKDPHPTPGKIQRWILNWYKQRYENVEISATLEYELDVFLLCINKQGKLAHVLGIGKEFDSSDVEHLLCMFYTIHQFTGPNRNVAKNDMCIDGEKNYPVKYASGKTISANLSFMGHLNERLSDVLAAYSFLYHSEEYLHKRFSRMMRIEFDVEEDI